MAVNRPYYRTYRQFTDGKYAEGGRARYVDHPSFAQAPEKYVRAFTLLQKDLLELFDYIEPADTNLNCFSYRIHALLVRACIEFESNCKAILRENGYAKDNMNICDYWKLEKTHLLSKYEVKVPYWTGKKSIRRPFETWANTHTLLWYSAYNDSKHDRQEQFQKASFSNLIGACCGTLVILSSQFGTNDFSPGPTLIALEGSNDGLDDAIGGYFRIKFPNDFPKEMRYDFNWSQLGSENDPFQRFDYSTV